MQKRKDEGGMGFRDFQAMNVALIGKQMWRIHENPTALWVKLYKSLYFPNGSIWVANKRE